jgi:thiol peroxidase
VEIIYQIFNFRTSKYLVETFEKKAYHRGMEKVTLKGHLINLVGSIPIVGSKAPALFGVDPEWKERELHSFKEKKKIICFVPSLDTPICSISAQKFNEKVQGAAAIIYCSMDLPFALKRLCEGFKHVTPLSLFRSAQVAEAFGVLQNSGPLKGLCARAVFVLDESDTILYYELVQEITNEPNYDQALKFVS